MVDVGHGAVLLDDCDEATAVDVVGDFLLEHPMGLLGVLGVRPVGDSRSVPQDVLTVTVLILCSPYGNRGRGLTALHLLIHRQ